MWHHAGELLRLYSRIASWPIQLRNFAVSYFISRLSFACFTCAGFLVRFRERHPSQVEAPALVDRNYNDLKRKLFLFWVVFATFRFFPFIKVMEYSYICCFCEVCSIWGFTLRESPVWWRAQCMLLQILCWPRTSLSRQEFLRYFATPLSPICWNSRPPTI